MGLTGIQIFKLLPKTNCTECGVPTCLAFAMNLASGKAELDSCPYVSEEAREQLAEASAPPIRPMKIGSGDTEVGAGGETVLFRHEKTFYNPPGYAALITTDMPNDVIEAKLKNWMAYQYERVGLNLRPELVAIKDVKGDAGRFEEVVKLIQDKCDLSYILMSEDPGVIKKGVEISDGYRPLIYAATKDTADELGNLAKESGLPLAVKGKDIGEVKELTEKLTAAGLKDLVIDTGSREIKQAFEDSIALRRAALLKQDRTLGFPSIAFPCEMTDNLDMETLIASMFVAKYGGMVVLSDFQGESVFPLLLERLNIFTDPQRPMTVTQGIYEINGPDENSPVAITTNFSLTYFIVSGEIEASRVPTWLMIMDTEGLSVMTAWAAGKFAGDAAGMFIKKSGIEDKVKHKSIIIPGYAASISGDMEEELPGWKVLIGPREAAHVPKYLKEWKPE
jgi:acetyl-CoA decarbonylase/synthase, CODH/ACS complex subunit gamma